MLFWQPRNNAEDAYDGDDQDEVEHDSDEREHESAQRGFDLPPVEYAVDEIVEFADDVFACVEDKYGNSQ